MKVLVLAAALAALSSNALAGAAPDAQPTRVTDTTAATMLADAGHLGSASLSALGASPWSQAEPRTADPADAALGLPTEIDPGSLALAVTMFALLLARPVSRVLRRQEQQRRATALASTLKH